MDIIEATVNYEVACETITHLIAIHVEDLEAEMRKPDPDTVLIDRLNAECLQLAHERRALSPSDQVAVNAAKIKFAARVRALLVNRYPETSAASR